MTTHTAAPVIESHAEHGHLIFEIKVNGKVVATRWQHIVTGLHYVTDQRHDLIGEAVVKHARSERTAKVAFMRIYRELTA